MDAGTIGVFIPILGIMTGMVLGSLGIWTQHKRKVAEMEIEARQQSGQIGSDVANARIEELEDRIAVLERIITDNSVNVAAQIEALRDTTSIEQLTQERSKV
jgi:uncharacterized small protein (DUF1192 family)